MINAGDARNVIQKCLRDVKEREHRPSTNEWALTPEVMELVRSLVLNLRSTSVLEFGAGQSSVAIAQSLDALGGGSLTSIDHAPEYCSESWGEVRHISSVDSKLIPTSVSLQFTRDGLMFGYHQIEAELSRRGPYEFVLIDGPPGRFGRQHTLYAAWPSLADGAIVLLDDYRRLREQSTVKNWLKGQDGLTAVALDPGFGRGVAILQVTGARRRGSALNTLLGSVGEMVRYRGTRWQWTSQSQS